MKIQALRELISGGFIPERESLLPKLRYTTILDIMFTGIGR